MDEFKRMYLLTYEPGIWRIWRSIINATVTFAMFICITTVSKYGTARIITLGITFSIRSSNPCNIWKPTLAISSNFDYCNLKAGLFIKIRTRTVVKLLLFWFDLQSTNFQVLWYTFLYGILIILSSYFAKNTNFCFTV